MKSVLSIGEHIEQSLLSLPEWNSLEDFVQEFHALWLSLGQKVQQHLLQEKIEEIEARYQGARTKREKRYYTPLGEMVLKRRVYLTEKGLDIKVDEELELPSVKWLSPVLELACALGVSSEFPNAHKLFTKWTSIEITEKTLASQVEKVGNKLQDDEFEELLKPDKYSDESPEISEEKIYVGVDGVMTPLNQKQGYKEAKVGVIFWQKHHQKKRGKRGVVRQREYVATLKTREEFRERVAQLYQQIVKHKNPQTIVLGDGAHWIWDMAQEDFPGCWEILDFYHLSEYVWSVAKAGYPSQEEAQKKWVKEQQWLLKQSQWPQVILNCDKFKSKRKELKEAITDLERYLNNNKTRIDYQKYLKEGLMIGSGVVESSNRRIVTQRLKQAGMHWSKSGAEGVMAMRAVYLSSSNRWSNFWLSTQSSSRS
jgi:hypothetical protein